MEGKTHSVAGVCCASLVTITTKAYMPTDIQTTISWGLFMSGAFTGALIQDIDHTNSTVGKKHPIIAFFTRLFLGHRGFTHSLLALVILASFAFIIAAVCPFKIVIPYVTGFVIGAASHILMDALNPDGVPLLYPFIKDKFHVPGFKIKVGSFKEKLFFIPLALTTAGLIVFQLSHNNLLHFSAKTIASITQWLGL